MTKIQQQIIIPAFSSTTASGLSTQTANTPHNGQMIGTNSLGQLLQLSGGENKPATTQSIVQKRRMSNSEDYDNINNVASSSKKPPTSAVIGNAEEEV